MRLPHYSAVPRTFPFSNVPSRPFSNTKTLLVSLVSLILAPFSLVILQTTDQRPEPFLRPNDP